MKWWMVGALRTRIPAVLELGEGGSPAKAPNSNREPRRSGGRWRPRLEIQGGVLPVRSRTILLLMSRRSPWVLKPSWRDDAR